MTQVRIILGAVPGGSTDRHLQSLFGTHTVLRRNFSQGSGTNSGLSVTTSEGPNGSSIARSHSLSFSQQSTFGFTEEEQPVWTANDTLSLNYNKGHFVCMVSPGAELAHFGPGAILGIRDGAHLSFETINQLTEQALNDTPQTYVPNTPRQLLKNDETPAHTCDETRTSWLNVLNETADKLRKLLG